MSSISIVFGTPTNPNFEWYDGFKDVTDDELDEIAIYCRSATAAVVTELSDRRNPWTDRTLADYQETLLENATLINIKGLTNEHEGYLDNLYGYLAGPGNARNEVKIARQFLWLISKVTDWAQALLVLCTLGKHKLQKIDEDRRVKLVEYVVQHRDRLFCPLLKDEAVRCNLQQIRMNLPPLYSSPY